MTKYNKVYREIAAHRVDNSDGIKGIKVFSVTNRDYEMIRRRYLDTNWGVFRSNGDGSYTVLWCANWVNGRWQECTPPSYQWMMHQHPRQL
jgi:hypothetical protein